MSLSENEFRFETDKFGVSIDILFIMQIFSFAAGVFEVK